MLTLRQEPLLNHRPYQQREPAHSPIAGSTRQSQTSAAASRAVRCEQPQSTPPARASGATIKLINGIANALAIGLARDICPNNSTVDSTRPSVTTYRAMFNSHSAEERPLELRLQSSRSRYADRSCLARGCSKAVFEAILLRRTLLTIASG
jgi:hypothetical protein